MESKHSLPSEHESTQDRKAFEPSSLIKYGDIKDITQGNVGGVAPDGPYGTS